jgi:hypothetical protein
MKLLPIDSRDIKGHHPDNSFGGTLLEYSLLPTTAPKGTGSPGPNH